MSIRSHLLIPVTMICLYTGAVEANGQLTGNISTDKKHKVLRVGASSSLPPYMFEEKGQPSGFDVELVRAVGNALGYDVEVYIGEWNTIQKDFSKGKYDLLAGIADVPARRTKYEFSVPTCVISYAVFTSNYSGIHSLRDLSGKKVVVRNDGAMANYFKGIGASIIINYVREDIDALVLVDSGQYDATIMPKTLGLYYIHQRSLQNINTLDDVFLPQNHCIAAAKGNVLLIYQIDEGLEILKTNGKYREIYNRWFGVYEPAIPSRFTRWIIIGASLAAFLLLASIVFLYVLRHQVRQRTDALIVSEKKFRFIVENSSDLVFILDSDGLVTYISDQAETVTGYPTSEFINQSFFRYIFSEDAERVRTSYSVMIAGKKKFDMEYRLVDKNGNIQWLSHTAKPVYDRNGNLLNIQNTVRNITGQKEAQEALAVSEERYRRLVDCIIDYLFTVKIENGKVVSTINSPACISVTGYSAEEYAADPYLWFRMIHEEDRDMVKNHYDSLMAGTDMPSIEHRIIHKNGSVHWVRNSAVLHRDEKGNVESYDGLVSDITKRKIAEEVTRSSLKEKEALLRELYHRTKNNMQVIISMLRQQSNLPVSTTVKKTFLNMENRIHSMAMVHQKLYQSQNLSRINMKEYSADLGSLIMSSYSDIAKRITLTIDAEDVFVTIDVAVPFGLILNELISNSIKHAFPDNRYGVITIRLHRVHEGKILLEVRDNGVGIDDLESAQNKMTMGLKTILALGERQLKGKVVLKTDNGFSCEMEFDDSMYGTRV